MHVKSGDKVVVISGKDKGKIGKVMVALPRENRVIVEGVNIITKHKKATGPNSPSGILKYEAPIHASKVMFYSEKDKTGVRVGYDVKEDGSKVRVSKKSGEVLDK